MINFRILSKAKVFVLAVLVHSINADIFTNFTEVVLFCFYKIFHHLSSNLGVYHYCDKYNLKDRWKMVISVCFYGKVLVSINSIYM